MIVFDLTCEEHGHRFEGWFTGSDDYAAQKTRGLLSCPVCGSPDIEKAPMAPSLARKGNQVVAPVSNAKGPPADLIKALAAAQAEILKDSRWVGGDFADVSRAIHYGERQAEIVHGQATAQEARDLVEEGVALAPLPFPVAPPDKVN